MKTHVLDTNVLLTDTNAWQQFGNSDVVIPLVVIEELDNLKTRMDSTGFSARQVIRALDDMMQTGSLIDGVALRGGGKLRVEKLNESTQVPVGLENNKNDNVVVMTALQVKSRGETVLVTKDVSVRLKCDALGLKSIDFYHAGTKSTDKFYTGVSVIEVDEPTINGFYNGVATRLDDKTNATLHPNEIVVLKHVIDGQSKKSALARFIAPDVALRQVDNIEQVCGLKPRNKEQTFALDLLFDKDVKFVTLSGISGGGKSLIALAAGLEQLNGFGKFGTYEKMVIMRPVQPMGRDIGFLPGTLSEKLEPWIAPIKDNLSFLVNGKKHNSRRKKADGKNEEPYFSMLIERGLIEIEAATFIRGRSIPNAFMLIDECQNLSVHEMKTILTRVGEGTKIVCTGDQHQIDRQDIDQFSNGLTYVIDKFKDQKIAGHITMLKGERSELATLASKLL